jgi:hypothetical protein
MKHILLLAIRRKPVMEDEHILDVNTIINIVIKTNSVAQEPEGSSPHSKQPATGPYPEPVESNPHPPSQSP